MGDRWAGASLEELDAAAELLTRVDRKHLIPAGELAAVVTGIDALRVLEIDGRRTSRDESTYLDTVRLDSWTAAAHRRRRSWKVRTRRTQTPASAGSGPAARGAPR